MQLTFHDHGVEDVPAIVNRRVVGDRDTAGLRIDFDLRDMAAVGIGRGCVGFRLGVEAFGNFAARFHLGGAGGEIEQRKAPVGAHHGELARLVGNVVLRGLQQRCRDGLSLRQHGVERRQDGAAGRHRRARRDRGEAGDFEGRVAVLVADLLRRDAQSFGRQARENRSMSLAGRLYVEA